MTRSQPSIRLHGPATRSLTLSLTAGASTAWASSRRTGISRSGLQLPALCRFRSCPRNSLVLKWTSSWQTGASSHMKVHRKGCFGISDRSSTEGVRSCRRLGRCLDIAPRTPVHDAGLWNRHAGPSELTFSDEPRAARPPQAVPVSRAYGRHAVTALAINRVQ